MNPVKKNIALALLFVLLLSAGNLSAQKKTGYKLTLADSLEVTSITTIITAVYDLISGPAGERNWTKFKFLCLPNASFVSTKQTLEGKQEYFQGNIDDYIKLIDPVLKKSDYYENEVERNVQTSDNIANVFSSFESTLFTTTGIVNQRGTNSFQLIYKNERWWIANVLWKNEPNIVTTEPKK